MGLSDERCFGLDGYRYSTASSGRTVRPRNATDPPRGSARPCRLTRFRHNPSTPVSTPWCGSRRRPRGASTLWTSQPTSARTSYRDSRGKWTASYVESPRNRPDRRPAPTAPVSPPAAQAEHRQKVRIVASCRPTRDRPRQPGQDAREDPTDAHLRVCGGAACRNRTDDLFITSESLWPTELKRRARPVGLRLNKYTYRLDDHETDRRRSPGHTGSSPAVNRLSWPQAPCRPAGRRPPPCRRNCWPCRTRCGHRRRG